jgi:hypothetical protein
MGIDIEYDMDRKDLLLIYVDFLNHLSVRFRNFRQAFLPLSFDCLKIPRNNPAQINITLLKGYS